jgi:hypothetical protein
MRLCVAVTTGDTLFRTQRCGCRARCPPCCLPSWPYSSSTHTTAAPVSPTLASVWPSSSAGSLLRRIGRHPVSLLTDIACTNRHRPSASARPLARCCHAMPASHHLVGQQLGWASRCMYIAGGATVAGLALHSAYIIPAGVGGPEPERPLRRGVGLGGRPASIIDQREPTPAHSSAYSSAAAATLSPRPRQSVRAQPGRRAEEEEEGVAGWLAGWQRRAHAVERRNSSMVPTGASAPKRRLSCAPEGSRNRMLTTAELSAPSGGSGGGGLSAAAAAASASAARCCSACASLACSARAASACLSAAARASSWRRRRQQQPHSSPGAHMSMSGYQYPAAAAPLRHTPPPHSTHGGCGCGGSCSCSCTRRRSIAPVAGPPRRRSPAPSAHAASAPPPPPCAPVCRGRGAPPPSPPSTAPQRGRRRRHQGRHHPLRRLAAAPPAMPPARAADPRPRPHASLAPPPPRLPQWRRPPQAPLLVGCRPLARARRQRPPPLPTHHPPAPTAPTPAAAPPPRPQRHPPGRPGHHPQLPWRPRRCHHYLRAWPPWRGGWAAPRTRRPPRPSTASALARAHPRRWPSPPP